VEEMNPSDRFHSHARSYRHKITGRMICIHRNITMIGLHKQGIKLSEYLPELAMSDPKEK
jgi:hypothetical protein